MENILDLFDKEYRRRADEPRKSFDRGKQSACPPLPYRRPGCFRPGYPQGGFMLLAHLSKVLAGRQVLHMDLTSLMDPIEPSIKIEWCEKADAFHTTLLT